MFDSTFIIIHTITITSTKLQRMNHRIIILCMKYYYYSRSVLIIFSFSIRGTRREISCQWRKRTVGLVLSVVARPAVAPCDQRLRLAVIRLLILPLSPPLSFCGSVAYGRDPFTLFDTYPFLSPLCPPSRASSSGYGCTSNLSEKDGVMIIVTLRSSFVQNVSFEICIPTSVGIV